MTCMGQPIKMDEKQNIAVLVGAGQGKRLGFEDKAFLEIYKKPLLAYCIQAFENSKLTDSIICVVREEKIFQAEKIINDYSFEKVIKIVKGGMCRQTSVYNGLIEAKNAYIVAIHDVARPLVTSQMIDESFMHAAGFGAAIPAIGLNDTIKKADVFVHETLDRESLKAAQTPQAFRYQLIFSAYEKAKDAGVCCTDDSSIVEMTQHPVKIFEGSRENIKITYPEDILLAKELLKKRTFQ